MLDLNKAIDEGIKFQNKIKGIFKKSYCFIL